ncbi:hypothetical protein LJR015_004208 [Peribacillus frigoritolerans]|uniref:hypothetical protein n=1 Tax=Peribacillus frigoritolerans TaxID=450367 RepID=UPI003ED102AB
MRKFICVFVALLAIGTNILPVQAEKNHQHNSKGQDKSFRIFSFNFTRMKLSQQ